MVNRTGVHIILVGGFEIPSHSIAWAAASRGRFRIAEDEATTFTAQTFVRDSSPTRFFFLVFHSCSSSLIHKNVPQIGSESGQRTEF